MKKVLLTGVTGFLGSHTAIQLLEKGYEVIGTLRNMNRAGDIKKLISAHTKNSENLSFVEAELTQKEIWYDITKGVDYILHIASPFPREVPKDENDLIIPAKEGVMNIMQAATSNNVKKVVITSSSAAILYGKEKGNKSATYTEKEWTNVQNRKDTTPYFRSKTYAEKAAWEFINTSGSNVKLTTICPGAILGPVLEEDFGTSANIVLKLLDGSAPGIPRLGFEVVDVRSVADLHIKAMESDKSDGERFVATAGYLSLMEVADILREVYPDKKIPKTVLPNFAVSVFSLFEKTVRPVLLDLGVERRVDNSKPVSVLNWEPLSARESVLACAESLFKEGILE